MQAIYDIVNKIGEFFSNIWDFIQTIVEWTIQLVEYVGKAVTMAYDFVAAFPNWIKAFAVMTILISVIYTILGRAGGNSE